MSYKFKAINRQSSAIRRKNIESISNKLGIDIEIFESIDYRGVLRNNSLINSLFKDADYWEWDINQWGVISCNLSHMMVWLECYKEDVPFFIFEDDIHINHPIDFLWRDLINDDFDVLILKGGENYEFQPYCDCYCVNPKSAIKLYNWFIKNGWKRTLDYEFEYLHNNKIFNIKSLNKHYFIQNRELIKSDIANDGITYKKIE